MKITAKISLFLLCLIPVAVLSMIDPGSPSTWPEPARIRWQSQPHIHTPGQLGCLFRKPLAEETQRKPRMTQIIWNPNRIVAMSQLGNLFPTMRGVPGINPWNVDQLVGWLNTGAPTSGSRNAAMFMLGVWNPNTNWKEFGLRVRKGSTGRFDMFRAVSCWDPDHLKAFHQWLANPFFP